MGSHLVAARTWSKVLVRKIELLNAKGTGYMFSREQGAKAWGGVRVSKGGCDLPSVIIFIYEAILGRHIEDVLMRSWVE